MITRNGFICQFGVFLVALSGGRGGGGFSWFSDLRAAAVVQTC